jgi:hypothetical protein
MLWGISKISALYLIGCFARDSSHVFAALANQAIRHSLRYHI